ncbi:hypothetical protein CL655_03440 [bacterium]|nr:hypothetical protein [bacterium]|tara:strand:+ start:3789 stop:4442 length:654 start_codon:yes stop_codon:yes gene_type:complete
MRNHHIVITLGVGLALCFAFASLYIEQSQRTTVLTLERAIAKQEQRLTTLAELTAQNRADAVAEVIIRDCSPDSRRQFEQLLNNLANLTATELDDISRLFDACGGFFAERKAVIVARLEREFEVYNEYVSLLTALEPAAVSEYPVLTWQSLVDFERERGDLLSEQVDIQGEIIVILQTGVPDPDVLEAKLVRAQQVSNRVAELNTTIADIRQSLYAI